ncbi:MAG: TrmB family transcriptional regulator [Patescibacteria group bacterium]
MSKQNPQHLLNEALETAGMTQKEIKIYLELLKIGSGKAGILAKKTELNRTTVYDVLEGLVQKGVVSRYHKGSQTIFSATNPELLINYLENEKQEKVAKAERDKKRLEELMPQFISLQDIAPMRPKVQFFEGEKGMREAYEDTLASREPIMAYANVATMHEALPNFFPQYYKRRANKKIYIRAICPDNALSRERHKHDQDEMREIRFLPNVRMSFSPEVNIYNNKMLIASWKEKMAIIIESKELAELEKIKFELIWQALSNN